MLRILFVILFFSVSAHAGEVTVFGKCEKSVLPDRVALTFSAEHTASTTVQAQRKTTEIYEAIRNEIKKMNFKDQELQTESINVYEDVDWSNNKKTSRGFKSSMSLKFITSEIDRAGSVIPAVLKVGAQGMGQLQLFLSDETYDKAYKDCLSVALASAQDKAKRLLKGHSVGDLKLLEAVEGQNMASGSRPFMMKAMNAVAEMDSAPGLETKGQKIEVSVTAKFKF